MHGRRVVISTLKMGMGNKDPNANMQSSNPGSEFNKRIHQPPAESMKRQIYVEVTPSTAQMLRNTSIESSKKGSPPREVQMGMDR